MKWTLPVNETLQFFARLCQSADKNGSGRWPDSINLIRAQVLSSLPDRVTISWTWELLDSVQTPSAHLKNNCCITCFTFLCLFSSSCFFLFFSITLYICEMVDMIWFREILSKGFYSFLQEIQHTLSFFCILNSYWLWRLPPGRHLCLKYSTSQILVSTAAKEFLRLDLPYNKLLIIGRIIIYTRNSLTPLSYANRFDKLYAQIWPASKLWGVYSMMNPVIWSLIF